MGECLGWDEAKYRLILEQLPDMVLLHVDGDIIFANAATKGITGYDPAEVIGKNVFDMMPDQEQRIMVRDINTRRTRGERVPDTYELDIRSKSGAPLHVEVRAMRIDYEGRDARLVIITDLTARRESEAKLRASEERFRSLAEMLPECVYETDARGVITYVNQAGLEMFGYSPSDLEKGFSVADIFDARELARAMKNRNDTIAEGVIRRVEYTALHRDGHAIPVIFHTVPVIRDGVPVGTRGIVIDISERKRLEEAHIRAGKLESVGLLAGGIAHDFNNILTIIAGNISLARIIAGDDHRMGDILGDAEKAALRARGLTSQLLTLARGGEPIKRNASINDIITGVTDRLLIGSPVRLNLDVPHDLPPVAMDEAQISQVMYNLVLNALQAMPRGGTLSIRCAIGTLPADNSQQLTPGDYLQVSVADTGEGIAPEEMPHIFDPYYTTKETGHGLGLATAYSIIRKHGGYMDARSVFGDTEFRFLLPALTAAASTGVIRVGERPNILVLEDERDITRFLEAVFTRLGYSYEITHDGADTIAAYSRARAAGSGFNVILLDLSVESGMGGREAMAEILAIDPSARGIVCSGYSTDPVMAHYADYGFFSCLSKPYVVDTLVAEIAKALKR